MKMLSTEKISKLPVRYSLTLCYLLHNVKKSEAFNSVIVSQIIQLIQVNETSHDSTEWGFCRKVCAKRDVMYKRYLS